MTLSHSLVLNLSQSTESIPPLDVASDELLVRAVLNDDSEHAFRILYRRHSPRVYRLALRLLGSHEDAEDALQDVWVRVIPRLGAFRWESSLSSWLGGFAVNVARERLEARRRWNMVELEEGSALAAVPDGDLDLERAIALLPAAARAAFVLHDIEGFTHEEIAQRLGWVAGTSKTQVFRARRALRRLLMADDIQETQA